MLIRLKTVIKITNSITIRNLIHITIPPSTVNTWPVT
jgi:hypothetical protein